MDFDSLFSTIMIQALISIGLVAAVVAIGIVVLLRALGRSGNAAAAAGRMSDPVPGTLLVTAVSMPTESAIYHSARLTGVISAEGVEAVAVQHSGLIRTSKWPSPGQSLPVVVDRANPQSFAIEWDKIADGQSAAMANAEALAAAMRERDAGS